MEKEGAMQRPSSCHVSVCVSVLGGVCVCVCVCVKGVLVLVLTLLSVRL